ncbi:unnamed protein product, partial [Heterosigma akashiwo]
MDENKKKDLEHFCEKVENNMIFTESKDVQKVHNQEAANGEQMQPEENHASTTAHDENKNDSTAPTTTQSVVLQPPQPSGNAMNVSSQPPDDPVPHIQKQTIPISRGPNPLNEWQDKVAIATGNFPTIFLRGQRSIPPGTRFGPALIKKLIHRFDGRCQNNAQLFGFLFNMQQRHAAIQGVAKAATTNRYNFKLLGRVTNNPHFKDMLQSCVNDPKGTNAKRISYKIMQIFTTSGQRVPFSPFEKNNTFSLLTASTFHFGPFFNFLTYTPSEFEDITTLRVPLIKKFN